MEHIVSKQHIFHTQSLMFPMAWHPFLIIDLY